MRDAAGCGNASRVPCWGGALLSCAEAKAIIEAWRHHYNEVPPHASLGY